MPLVGRSPAMQEIYRTLARLMQTDLTVMITGESGTGKELVARALHDYGKRKNGPFVAINMAAIPARPDRERTVRPREGRLHRRRQPRHRPVRAGRRAARCSSTKSATCRWRRRPGCCACCSRANTRRSAGARPSRTNVRIVAATNKDLRILDPAGPVPRGPVLPPQRRADAPAAAARAHRGHPDLVRHFFKLAATEGLPLKHLDDGALDRLKRYRWPGNIRELENLMRRLAALYPQERSPSAGRIGARFDAAPASISVRWRRPHRGLRRHAGEPDGATCPCRSSVT